jgi:hypothetical protein
MAYLSFQFKKKPLGSVPLTKEDIDDNVFAEHLSEVVKLAVETNADLLISLDIHDIDSVSFEELKNVMNVYYRIYIHRNEKPHPLSGTFSSKAETLVSSSFLDLTATERIALLTVLHYLGNNNLLMMSMRSFAEILSNLSVKEIRDALGINGTNLPSATQLSELNRLLGE